MDKTSRLIIFLTGPRGCGKSSTGAHLADILKCPFIDLDNFICTKFQKNVAEIVAESGWPGFRKIESECLREAVESLENGAVIATGGGTPLAKQNREYMRNNGRVAWLVTNSSELLKRLQANLNPEQRPSLTGLSALAEIEQIVREREPVYRECAHMTIDGERSIEEICEEILQKLGNK